MRIILLLSLIFTTQILFGQSDKLNAFENLIGSTWISNGKQLGGHTGKTVKEFEAALEGNIIKVKTYTTDPQTLEFGIRNEGIRIFNSETERLEFYEFDKLGGVSKGIVIVENKDIHYEYQYDELLLRDSWIYQSDDEYLYRVCAVSENSECSQIYHEGKFIKQKK